MFKTVAELKKFIIWAKSQGLKRVKVGDVEVEIADLTILASQTDLSELTPNIKATEEKDTDKTILDEIDSVADPEELYWSAN